LKLIISSLEFRPISWTFCLSTSVSAFFSLRITLHLPPHRRLVSVQSSIVIASSSVQPPVNNRQRLKIIELWFQTNSKSSSSVTSLGIHHRRYFHFGDNFCVQKTISLTSLKQFLFRKWWLLLMLVQQLFIRHKTQQHWSEDRRPSTAGCACHAEMSA